MYKQLANYYDEIYHFKNYQKESEKIETLIQKHRKSPGNRLLDVACGTGNHITYLKQHYNVEGLDLSSDMLRIARKKHPDVVFHMGDMTSFKLKNRFDVITCLFSAIGHVKTKTRMRRAVRTMANHLQPGSLMILEPWITPANFRKGRIGWDFVDKPNLKIARININKVRGPISAFEYHYLIGTPSKVEYVLDKVSQGLWTHKEHLEAFRDAGLKVSFDSEGLTGRGLYLGIKP
ncbi:MAG TPA: class I SAM-dependent methyltransferase [Candidatus Angelobacter sp.]|nr:class I SAM-dependent methyltransferase [Candidatus Angelobacter sp.]